MAAVLAAARELVSPTCAVTEIAAPGTLEGGDVIVYGDRIAIGLSKRTDRHGAEQLAALVAPRGTGRTCARSRAACTSRAGSAWCAPTC